MTIFKKLFVPNRNGHLILNWAISIMLLESHTLAMAQEVPTDPAGQAARELGVRLTVIG